MQVLQIKFTTQEVMVRRLRTRLSTNSGKIKEYKVAMHTFNGDATP